MLLTNQTHLHQVGLSIQYFPLSESFPPFCESHNTLSLIGWAIKSVHHLKRNLRSKTRFGFIGKRWATHNKM